MWWGYLAQVLLIVIGPLVWEAVKILGFSVAAYEGFDVLMSFVRSEIQGYLGGSPAFIMPMLILMKFDVGINIILSAVTVKFVLAGVREGRRRTTVWNPPGVAGSVIKMPF